MVGLIGWRSRQWWLLVALFVRACVELVHAEFFLNGDSGYDKRLDAVSRELSDDFLEQAFNDNYESSEHDPGLRSGDLVDDDDDDDDDIYHYSALDAAEQLHVKEPTRTPTVGRVFDNEHLPEGWEVFCCEKQMMVVFPAGQMEGAWILGTTGSILVLEAPKTCGYNMTTGLKYDALTISFWGCHVMLENGRYAVRMMVPANDGQKDVTLSCAGGSHPLPEFSSSFKHLVSSDASSVKAEPPCTMASPSSGPGVVSPLNRNSQPGGCSIPHSQRVQCGFTGISKSLCLDKGCCVDPTTATCFYPMNECTADGNFVFAVYFNADPFPADCTSVVAGKGKCHPVIKTHDIAIFKFAVTDCGTRAHEVGEGTVYIAEVLFAMKILNMKYGIISRSSPLRLLVECHYLKSGSSGLASTGYMVTSPSLPHPVVSGGLFSVQLRIAKDQTYQKFYPHNHQPLRLLLGKSVFLEVALVSPKSTAVLLVKYCLAYPRSATNALILLFEGCPNPLDYCQSSLLHVGNLLQSKHRRRFEIKTFQFMALRSKRYLNEEIYFMCSTELCHPSETSCDEGCFSSLVSGGGIPVLGC